MIRVSSGREVKGVGAALQPLPHCSIFSSSSSSSTFFSVDLADPLWSRVYVPVATGWKVEAHCRTAPCPKHTVSNRSG